MAKKKVKKKTSVPLALAPEKIREVAAAVYKPQRIPVSKLSPNPENMRKHTERSIKSISESLLRFGMHGPLVVRKSDNVVMNGNGRLEALQRLAEQDPVSWSEVPCVVLDEGEIESQLRAIADNRTGEHSQWDYERFGKFIQEIADNSKVLESALPGWNQSELEPLLKATWTPPAIEPLPVTEHKPKEEIHDPSTDPQMKAVYVLPKDYAVLEEAATIVRDTSGKSQLSLGECVVRICRGYVKSKKG